MRSAIVEERLIDTTFQELISMVSSRLGNESVALRVETAEHGATVFHVKLYEITKEIETRFMKVYCDRAKLMESLDAERRKSKMFREIYNAHTGPK
jgi:hypothetical protein